MMKYKVVGIKVPTETAEYLDEVSAKTGLTVAAIFRMALMEHLNISDLRNPTGAEVQEDDHSEDEIPYVSPVVASGSNVAVVCSVGGGL